MSLATTFITWFPAAFWAGLIFYFSSIPSLNSGLGEWDFWLRKAAHMVEFGVLALLIRRAARRSWPALAPAGASVVAGVLSVLYAVSDEFHQSFVPGRGPSAADVAVDAAGIFLALLVFRQSVSPSGRVVATARKLSVALISALVLSGCGADAAFKRAKGAEEKGSSYQAWKRYQAFAARFPSDARAPEALFRAGALAQNELGDCDAARAFYGTVADKYAESEPWAAMASFQAENFPDYFPLNAGTTWTEGDSDSGGKNARIESVVNASSGTARIPNSSATITRTYYAGTSRFKSADVLYRKDGATVWEHGEGGAAPRAIIKAPLKEGTKWNSLVAGRDYIYEIVSTTRTVVVGAGTFENCLLVSGRTAGIPGATNEYFAPSVGRVMTSFSTAAGERRNTELLSFTPAGPAEIKK